LIKNNGLSNSAEGMFVSMDELNNIDFLNGKQTPNGGLEFSNTKQWTKNMKIIETEQRNQQQIISEIKKLEEKIDVILQILLNYESNNISIDKENEKGSELFAANNFTWKDKLKNILK